MTLHGQQAPPGCDVSGASTEGGGSEGDRSGSNDTGTGSKTSSPPGKLSVKSVSTGVSNAMAGAAQVCHTFEFGAVLWGFQNLRFTSLYGEIQLNNRMTVKKNSSLLHCNFMGLPMKLTRSVQPSGLLIPLANDFLKTCPGP